MPNVVRLRPAVLGAEETLTKTREDDQLQLRPKFSFDMTQPDPRGFVLIDACVPLELAIEFMNLLAAYNTT